MKQWLAQLLRSLSERFDLWADKLDPLDNQSVGGGGGPGPVR